MKVSSPVHTRCTAVLQQKIAAMREEQTPATRM